MHLVKFELKLLFFFRSFLVLELTASEDDKRCYACKEADDECVATCPWTQRCFIKAKHANSTSS